MEHNIFDKKRIGQLFQAAAPFVAIGGDSVSTGAFSGDLASAFVFFFKIALSAGAILAMFQIARAGFIYMYEGVDNHQKLGNAKTIFQDAIIGLLLLFGIYLILNTINPDILKLDALKNDISSSGSQ